MPLSLARLGRAILLPLLALAPVARAEVTLALAPPPGALEPGRSYRIHPDMTGADDERRCWWGLFRDGRRLGPGDGVRLEPAADGGASLALDPGIPAGDLRLRVTSRKDPTRFAVVTVPVAPAAPDAGRPERRSQFVSRTPAGDSEKGDAPAAGGAWERLPAPPATLPAEEPKDASKAESQSEPAPWVWRTQFRLTPADAQRLWPSLPRRDQPRIVDCAWDPSAAKPSIVAICTALTDGDEAQAVARLACDGGVTVLASTDPKGPGAHGPWRSACAVSARRIAVRAGGGVLVTDQANAVVWEFAEGLAPRIIAGIPGKSAKTAPDLDLSGERAVDGAPPLAAGTALGLPYGVAIDAGGEVVFADTFQCRVYRITASGHLVTLAGSGHGSSRPGPLSFPIDLDLPRPALACALEHPSNLAIAPDGRILVLVGSGSLVALHPDGTVEHLDHLEGLAQGSRPAGIAAGKPTDHRPISHLAVTSGNALIYAFNHAPRYRSHHYSSDRWCRLLRSDGDDGEPREWVGNGLTPGTHPQPLIPAAEARFRRLLGPLAPIPGGGTLVLGEAGTFLAGSGRGDASLAGMVREAVQAAFEGRGDRHDAIVRSLRAWVDDPREADRAKVMLAAFGKKGPLPPDPRGLAGGFLRDPKAMAFRAQLALDAIAELTGWDGGRWQAAETKAPGESAEEP